MFDVDMPLLNIAINIDSLTKSWIYIIPKEKMKDDETADCVATDFIILARVMKWVFKDMDNFLENNFKGKNERLQ